MIVFPALVSILPFHLSKWWKVWTSFVIPICVVITNYIIRQQLQQDFISNSGNPQLNIQLINYICSPQILNIDGRWKWASLTSFLLLSGSVQLYLNMSF